MEKTYLFDDLATFIYFFIPENCEIGRRHYYISNEFTTGCPTKHESW